MRDVVALDGCGLKLGLKTGERSGPKLFVRRKLPDRKRPRACDGLREAAELTDDVDDGAKGPRLILTLCKREAMAHANGANYDRMRQLTLRRHAVHALEQRCEGVRGRAGIREGKKGPLLQRARSALSNRTKLRLDGAMLPARVQCIPPWFHREVAVLHALGPREHRICELAASERDRVCD